MRTIAIVGGGHAGLQLGIGLLQHKYGVTIVTDREPDAVRKGRIMSSQGMQHTALEYERKLGLNYWDGVAPTHHFIEFSSLGQGGKPDLVWRAERPNPGNSVCQRVKIPRWTEEFQRLGGDLRLSSATIADVDALAQSHDLVIIAAGKGEIGKLFQRDGKRSPFDKPQRALGLTYVFGMRPTEPHGVTFNVAPGVGEYLVMPALTTGGECHAMVYEGQIGGPMDCWSDVKTPAEHLARSKEILERFFPWESARCASIELTDENAMLSGRFAPTVRKPLISLPSGRSALGIADVVMVNDPLTGQGSNNASKFAWHYLHKILDRGDQPFDAAWMEEVFESFWCQQGCLTTEWSNRMLAPHTRHMHDVIVAAKDHPRLAQHFVDCFDHPPHFFPWLFDRQAAEVMFGEIFSAREAAGSLAQCA
ncbi:styrene monooxygenase/indole monooxygenase family protein [Pusillimonas noertemannii]|uniref:2-polyprenyl-6-methoxyphenol hydroxylase-like FAD-dependent oxidoreductase n=1 Tax=Pusillimonas noertemannii TaxID=305977 RepID=A0A2U1CL44_9BURK|nr:styrene monooxygenase/indole monooxygenase family protein [Pusillimonas noertemannii]NYT69237.1 FAD-binding oxidoreductase [Pusillimonas noertemannii]PVY61704.1 2-polyprenyl-6-methoxyphenol hydroxylase-like FAD-dependent oxidoreductase [Pusillimonas noertemannii]